LTEELLRKDIIYRRYWSCCGS